MKSLDFGRYALTSCVAVAMLAGCGGSQPPIGAPGITSKIGTTSGVPERDRPWVLPEAKNSDLMYVISYERIYMLSYPAGKLVGSFSANGPHELCSDGEGNVFVTLSSNQITEYAHGGTSPIKTISDPGDGPTGCSVDPTTGNLAVANGGNGTAYNANVVIYPGTSGPPETFTDPSFARYGFCGYDDEGNLFVTGTGPSGQFRLAELSKGSSTFTDIALDKPVVDGGGGSIQWDGQYMALAAQAGIIYRITGSSGHVLGTVRLNARKPAPIFWIQSNRIITQYALRKLGLWKYPAGGRPTAEIQGFLLDQHGVSAETVSVPPAR